MKLSLTRIFRMPLLALVATVTCSQVYAANYYVATTGFDSNPGTQAQPWLTIAKAASTASAGDTVTIAAGTYSEYVTVSKAGTAAAPITFVGPATLGGFNITGNYIVLKNLTLDKSYTSSHPLVVNGSNSTVDGISIVMRGASAGIDVGGSSNVLKNLTIDGGSVHAPGPPAQMVAISGNNNLFTKSVMKHGRDIDAFKLFGNANTISYNEITDLTNPQYSNSEHTDFIQTFGDNGQSATNMVIEGNYVHDCDAQLANLTTDIGNIHDFTFRNNVFANVASCVFLGIQNTKFYNNLFYKCGTSQSDAILVYGITAYNPAGSEFVNNIFLQCGSGSASSGCIGANSYNLSTLKIDHNYFGGTNYATKTGFMGTNPINGGDPKFVNPTSGDYHLQGTSPLVDKGVTLTGFSIDRDGVARPQGNAWDLGPYEYNTGIVATPPTAPKNIKVIAP